MLPRGAALAVCAALALCAGNARADSPQVLDKPPRLVHFVEAVFPEHAEIAQGAQVEVVLTIDVDETGKVSQVEVARSAGADFDQAALAAARQFVFEPGQAGGKPVPVRITYSYRFAWKPPAPSAEPAPSPAGPPLTGRVLSKGDRVPVPDVTIVLSTDPLLDAVSGADGRFQIESVPPGDYKVKLRGPGINALDTKLKLKPGKRVEVTFYVPAKERYASTVRGRRVVVETIEETLQADEIKRIPGTQGDVLKSVQNLPGVARAPFGIGLLVVWGSAPQDTRTYVDGVFIPTLYHFGGLRSTVNGEMVQSLTFTPGGYGVEHGLGLGGVVDVETRHPRRDGYHGYAQLDLIDASLMVEGPIGKKVSFAVAVRRSIIDAFLRRVNTSQFQLSPIYWDYQARLTYRPTPRDDLDLFIYGSDDAITLIAKNDNPELTAEFGSHTYYHRGVLSWLHRFANRATLSLTASVGWDVPFQIRTARGDSVTSIDAGSLSYTFRAVARVPLTSFLRLDAGFDFEGTRFTLDRTSTTAGGGGGGGGFGGFGGGGGGGNGMPDAQEIFTSHPAPFLSAIFSFFDHRLTITPQLRLQVLTWNGYPGTAQAFSGSFTELEPRLSLRYQIKPWMAIKAAVGVYHQAPQPQQLSTVFGNPKLEPEISNHYVFGLEFRPTSTLRITVEGFYKELRNLVVSGESATDPLLINEGLGRVYGGELLIRQELWKNFWGWISYTVSRSERKAHADRDWALFGFDQTHILTLIASYKLPKGFQLGLRFRYVTGNPMTPVLGAYYDSNRDRYVPISGPTNSGRLGAFNALDLRFDKTFTFNLWRLSIYLDLQNLYNASNPEGIVYNFNYTEQATINSLPILPVLGIRGDF